MPAPRALIGDHAVGRAVRLNGLPLGVTEKADYTQTRAHLERGDVLLLTTDGITEARRGKEFLDYEGMTNLARQSRSVPALEGMGRAIVAGAREFGGGVFRDDVCLLLARRN